VQIPGVISTFVVFRLSFLTAVSYHVTSLNAASSAIRMTWCFRTMCVGVHILSVSSVLLCLWLWIMSDCEGILLSYVNSWYHKLVCRICYWHYCVLVTSGRIQILVSRCGSVIDSLILGVSHLCINSGRQVSSAYIFCAV
jgi:hypothetical protein